MTLPERPLDHVLERVSDSEAVQPNDVYPLAGIYSFGHGLIRRESISGADTKYTHLTKLHSGQLVMSKLNAWEGALAVVSDGFAGSYVSSEYPVFNIDSSVASTSYLKHLASWPVLWEKLTPRGSMVRRKRTKPEVLLQTCVPLPDLDEQRRIAAKLDSASTMCDHVSERIDRAEEISANILHETFSEVRKPATMGSAITPQVDVVDIHDTASYQLAGVRSFGNGLFKKRSISGDETKYKHFHRIHSDTLVLSRLKAFEGAITVASEEFDGMFLSPEYPTFAIHPEKIDPAYLKHLCSWPTLWGTLKGKSKGVGARRERVNANSIAEVEIPLPGLQEQRQIAQRLDQVAIVTKLARQQRAHLKALRSSLLNAAFTGKL